METEKEFLKEMKKNIEEKIAEIKEEMKRMSIIDLLNEKLASNEPKEKSMQIIDKIKNHFFEKSKEEIIFFEGLLAEINQEDIETKGMVS